MRYLSYCEPFHSLLQPIEEARRLETVHLGVVELERDGQRRFEEPSAVFAPGQERIGEQFGIDTCHTVNLAFRQRRSVNGHIFVAEKMVFVRVVHLTGQPQILFVELMNILRKGNIAEANGAVRCLHNGVDRQTIVQPQMSAGRQRIELLDRACRMSDAPAYQHIGLHPAPLGDLNQSGDIEGLENGHLRHPSRFPQLESKSARRVFGVDFVFHIVSFSEFLIFIAGNPDIVAG